MVDSVPSLDFDYTNVKIWNRLSGSDSTVSPPAATTWAFIATSEQTEETISEECSQARRYLGNILSGD